MIQPSERPQTHIQTLIDGLIKDAADYDQEHERMMDQVQESSIVTLTPWLRRTGWTRTFRGKDMKKLTELMEKPAVGEPQLLMIWESVERVIKKSYEGVKDCWDRNWILIPFWLVSGQKNEESTKPFRTYYSESTVTRYTSYWQQFITFCIRVSLLDLEEFGVQFTSSQMDSIRDLRSMVELENPTDEELDRAVLALSVMLIKHADYLKEKSALIYFTGVLGYNTESKQWINAGNKVRFSPDIRIIYSDSGWITILYPCNDFGT